MCPKRALKVQYFGVSGHGSHAGGVLGSVDRFAESASSKNPSDADPVYTASVPKKRVTYAAADDDQITSRPLASAPLGAPNYASNNYNYKKPTYYKQPIYSEPTYVDTAKNTTVDSPRRNRAG